MRLDMRALLAQAKAQAKRSGKTRYGPTDRIVTLNMGLGRDSVAMLCLLAEGKLVAQGRKLSPSDIDAVVFSDTGAEWLHTHGIVPKVAALCRRLGVPFYMLSKPSDAACALYLDEAADLRTEARSEGIKAKLGSIRHWRKKTGKSIEQKARIGWYHLLPPIRDDYYSRATIASRAKADCTENHKVAAIRKLIDDLSRARFGVGNRGWSALVEAGEALPHLSLVGIAADEPSRVVHMHPLDPPATRTPPTPRKGQPLIPRFTSVHRPWKYPKGRKNSRTWSERPGGWPGPWYVTEAYPLVELGVAKDDEQAILDRHGFGGTYKSGCWLCPHQPVGWFWVLREAAKGNKQAKKHADPRWWGSVVEYERAALEANPNMKVIGSYPSIPIAVERWRAKNPRATIEEVMQKDYARGGSGECTTGECDHLDAAIAASRIKTRRR